MRFLAYMFYGGCWAVLAGRWFEISDWQWWLIVIGLAVMNSIIIISIIEKDREKKRRLSK